MSSSNLRKEPILVPAVRSALSHLYSTTSSSTASSQAHAYLIEFQSRNVRRKIHALVQRENDSPAEQQQQEQAKRKVLMENGGSSMYASLSFLLSAPSNQSQNSSNHDTEQLFCAQTVLHRLRRMKLSEAVDFELEYDSGSSNPIALMEFVMQCNQYRISESDSFEYWKDFTTFHCKQLLMMFQNVEHNHGFVLILNRVIEHYFNQQWNAKNANNYYDSRWGYGNEMEERIKGELMLLFLATISYYNTSLHSLLERQSSSSSPRKAVGPLLNTLSSAMAVIALRLRYTSSSVHNPNALLVSSDTTIQSLFHEQQQSISAAGTANDTPIVKMILQAIELVSKVAASMSLQQILPTVTVDQTMQIQQLIANYTTCKCLYIQLSTIPDALVGCSCEGGIRGRLSIDPKCVQYMNAELSTPSTGIQIVMDTMQYLINQQKGQSVDILQHQLFFLTCERWAKCIALPKDFVEQTISYSLNHILPNTADESTNLIQHSFCSYLISIFESACMTVTQIASFNVGLSDLSLSNSHPPGRKRQSSKSKKRQKERFDSVTNDQHIQQAENEFKHRGDVACHAAFISWDVLNQMFCQNLSLSHHQGFIAQGEGPIGCICACVSACLPHIIRHQDLDINKNALSKFVSSAMQSLKMICSNSNYSVRALSFEHVPIIHLAVLEKTSMSETQGELTEIETCIAKNLAECTISLAEQCAYPKDYFLEFSEDNNEDLEIERNDVRDIIRTLTLVNKSPQHVPLLLLELILQYCHQMIMLPPDQTNEVHRNLPPEPAVHMLSSPAKSLQCLAEILPSLDRSLFLENVHSIIHKTLSCISQICESVILAFRHNTPLHMLFPICRLTCICLASFSPFFSAMQCNATYLNSEHQLMLERILSQFICVVTESIKSLPELMHCSSLGDTAYDIRGAMRSPGGEDHVGCIAIMRLVVESDKLAQSALLATAKAKCIPITSVLTELVELYRLLQNLEMERGPVIFGKGVTPKSRRVFLTTLCRFCFIASQLDKDSATSIFAEVNQLFLHSIEKILNTVSRSDLPSEATLYCICEAIYDLSSFPPEFCSQLFLCDHSSEAIKRASNLIINTVVSGYRDYCSLDEPSDATIQWGRMRGALLALLRSACNPNLNKFGFQVTSALVQTECNLVTSIATSRESMVSSIFHSSVISEEVVPAGAYLIVIRDTVNNIIQRASELNSDEMGKAIYDCTSALVECLQSVFAALQSCHSVQIHWEDPRSYLMEAWYLTMKSLLIAYNKLQIQPSEQLRDLICQSLGLFIQLLMNKKIDKEYNTNDSSDGYISVDGPQSLALVEFLELALNAKGIGASIFALVSSLFQNNVNLDVESIGTAVDHSLVGGALITASLFRAASGGLPPWTIEYVPDIFKSLFESCGSVEAFCHVIQGGTELRLKQSSKSTFGVICPGKKVAGYFFDQMKPKARDEFLQTTMELCSKDDNLVSRWRRFKVLLKANSGGKKKATGFNLKPQPTSWDCDRL